jgi:elongation factor 2
LKENNGNLQRGFNQFILLPIFTLFDAINNDKKEVYEPIIRSLRLKISINDLKEAQTKKSDFLKLIMRNWLPAGNVLLDMIVDHLPSPIKAQKYRVENLYSGPLDSIEAESVRKCDPNGIVAMYVSKMVPIGDTGRFIAFGRVFSGTMKTGQEVRILGANYEYGKNKDLAIKSVQKVLLMMGKDTEQINECPAGNVCGLLGLDEFLVKSGTLTNSKEFYPFHTMKFSVSAVVQVAVEPKIVGDLPKLIEGLKRLVKSDPLVKCSTNTQGQHIIAGAGELHLEICLKDLQDDFMKGNEIVVSKPIVSFSETISIKTGEDSEYPTPCVSKSANKHNRLYVNAYPLDNKFINDIEEGKIKLSQDMKTFGRMLADEYKWNVEEARKIWSFGCPPDAKCNVIVDVTKGVQYLKECKDYIISGFLEATKGGVLCDEPLRGACFNIEDVKLHSDPAHRNIGQILPCARNVCYACEIASGPKLLEPVYLINIIVSTQAINGVYSTLNQRRGTIEKIEDCSGMSSSKIEGYLPVLESFGFIELLRKNTGGKAFAQMKFSHWQQVSGNPMKEGTDAYQIMMDVRQRKGLKLEIPSFNDYYVKIP